MPFSLHGWAVLTKWSVSSCYLFDLLTSEEDCLELLEVKHTIARLVVLGDHVVNFLTIDLFAELLHGEANILLRDLS